VASSRTGWDSGLNGFRGLFGSAAVLKRVPAKGWLLDRWVLRGVVESAQQERLKAHEVALDGGDADSSLRA